MDGSEPDIETPDTHAQVARLTRLLVTREPTLTITRARLLTQGWDSLVLAVNDAYIVRFARRPAVVAQFKKERTLLPALAPLLPTAIPRFTMAHIEDAETPFVGYPLLPGVPLTCERLTAYAPQLVSTLARQMAAFLSALHRFPVARAAELGVSSGDARTWRAEYTAFSGWVRERVLPLLTEAEREDVAALWERYLMDDANFRFTPALIHRDLAVEHILHDAERGELSGVIDWGDAAIGDPALDLTGLLKGAGEAFMERVLAGYTGPVDATFRRRVRFYADLAPFHALRFGLETGAEEKVVQGLALWRERARRL